MAFDLENGYQPRTFEEILDAVVAEVNAQFGATYDSITIVGNEFYRFFYAGIQEVMKSEAFAAEISVKLTDYIRTANEKINLPKSTISGFVSALKAPEAEGGLGLNSTIKDITNPAEAGYMFLVVDLFKGTFASGNATITNFGNLTSGGDDSITVDGVVFTAQNSPVTPGTATFEATTSNNATATSLAAQINAHATTSPLVTATANGAVVTITADALGVAGNSIALAYTNNDPNVGATVSGATLTGGTENPDFATIKQGIIDRMAAWLTVGLYYNGLEVGTKIAINGQVFTYKFDLPTPVNVLIRITVTTSANATTPILNVNQIRDIFNANFASLYAIGLNFEPEKYLEIERDLPFASDILLERSENGGGTWIATPRAMAYNEKIVITSPATVIVV